MKLLTQIILEQVLEYFENHLNVLNYKSGMVEIVRTLSLLLTGKLLDTGKEVVGNQMIIEKVSVFDMLSIILSNHESQMSNHKKNE